MEFQVTYLLRQLDGGTQPVPGGALDRQWEPVIDAIEAIRSVAVMTERAPRSSQRTAGAPQRARPRPA